MVHAEYVAALGLSQHPLRIWRDRLEESGDEMDWRSLLHPSARAQLSSAANCSRRKYRLTPLAADGRSNRRRFNDEQRRAMVQEAEKPGVSVAQVCHRHDIRHQPAFPLARRLRSDCQSAFKFWTPIPRLRGHIAGRMPSETHYSKLLTARHDDPSRTDATVSLISRVSLRRASLLG